MEQSKPVSCPLCQVQFKVPYSGLSRLPCNYFVERKIVEKLLAAQKEGATCFTCCKADKKSLVDHICLLCHMNMCNTCAKVHERLKAFKFHRTEAFDNIRWALSHHGEVCEIHPRQGILRFCQTCSRAVCEECCHLKHVGHSFLDLSKPEAIRNLKDKIAKTIQNIPMELINLTHQEDELTRNSQKFVDSVKRTECEIEEKEDHMVIHVLLNKPSSITKDLVHVDAEVLMLDLDFAKEATLKEFEAMRRSLGAYKLGLASFKINAELVISEGMPHDVARFWMRSQKKVGGRKRFKKSARVNFIPFDFAQPLAVGGYMNNVIGDIDVHDDSTVVGRCILL